MCFFKTYYHRSKNCPVNKREKEETVKMKLVVLIISCCIILPVIGDFQQGERRSTAVYKRKARVNGLFFDKTAEMLITADRYVIIIDEELTATTFAFEALREQVRQWEERIKYVPDYLGTRSVLVTMCNESIHELLTEADLIQHLIVPDKSVKRPEQWRRKRAIIPGSGTVLQVLFGVVTTSDMEDLHASIEKLTKSNDKMIEVQRLQAMYLNDTRGLAAATAREVENLNNQIEKYATDAGMAVSFMTAVQYVIQRCQTHLRDLRSGWEAVSRGKLSPQILPPEELLQSLEWVSARLPLDLQMVAPPGRETLSLYYDMARVVAAASGDKIRLFIYIPLSGPNRFFYLYRVRPIPMFIEQSNLAVYIQPESEYFAVTGDRTHFATLSTGDLLQCEQKSIVLCEPLWPIRKRNDKSCLFSLFTHDIKSAEALCNRKITRGATGTFVRAKQGDTWLYSLPEEVNAYLHCPPRGEYRALEDTFVLSGAGTLKVAPGCYLHTDTVKLLPRISIYQNITKQRKVNAVYPQLESLLTTKEAPIFKNEKSRKKIQELLEKVEGVGQNAKEMSGVPITAILKELDVAEELNKNAQDLLEKSKQRFQYLSWGIFSSATTILMAIACVMTIVHVSRCMCCCRK
jgi:hypothetical protein